MLTMFPFTFPGLLWHSLFFSKKRKGIRNQKRIGWESSITTITKPALGDIKCTPHTSVTETLPPLSHNHSICLLHRCKPGFHVNPGCDSSGITVFFSALAPQAVLPLEVSVVYKQCTAEGIHSSLEAPPVPPWLLQPGGGNGEDH